MNLLEKLTQQYKDGKIKAKDTLQDWFDTLVEEEFFELERLVALQEDDPEHEDSEILGLLVIAIYAIETDNVAFEEEAGFVTMEIEEEEFFKILNSFLFLLPFYYWLKQDLLKASTKISLVANMKNEITVTLTEYGK